MKLSIDKINKGAISVEQYKEAVTKALASKQVEILQILLNFPDSTATVKELAEVLNYKNYKSVSFQIGKAGKAIADYLEIQPEMYWDGKKESPSYFILIGPYYLSEGKTGKRDGYQMQKNLRIALQSLNHRPSYDTYLFIWNSTLDRFSDYKDKLKEFQGNGECGVTWLCSLKRIKPGDRAFVIKVGKSPKGIIGSGIIASEPYGGGVDIKLDTLLNYEEHILSINTLQTGILAKQYWTPQHSCTAIKTEIFEELEKKWRDYLLSINMRYIPASIIDKGQAETYTEGTAAQVILTQYERNPLARKTCIEYYGYSCSVCGFNFEEKYGETGKNFIHVHHLTPIAEINATYEIDPITDLRPVCPNCHAMIHRKQLLTIETLKSFLK